jgi:hypothetical protein
MKTRTLRVPDAGDLCTLPHSYWNTSSNQAHQELLNLKRTCMLTSQLRSLRKLALGPSSLDVEGQ